MDEAEKGTRLESKPSEAAQESLLDDYMVKKLSVDEGDKENGRLPERPDK